MIDTITLFGQSVSLYYTFWLFGLIAVLVIGCRLGRLFGFSAAKSILYVVGAVALGYLLLWVTSWIFGGGKANGLNFVRIVIFLPIPVLLLSVVFKDSFSEVADFVAPLLAIFHGVTHIGCIFEGCCHGYPMQWGIYSNIVEKVCFPIQLIEAVSSIIIGIILLQMIKKDISKGWRYAWYLLLFGATRFIWEFFRDNNKLWFGISELAFHALFAMALGALALAIRKHVNKGSQFYEK